MIGLWQLRLGAAGKLSAKVTVPVALVALCGLGLLAPAPVLRAAAGQSSARPTWTSTLQALLRRCEKIPQPVANAARYWRRLRLMQGAIGWRRWLGTLSAARRAELTTAIQAAGKHHLVWAVFSPSRRDRAMAATQLAPIAAPWSSTLLDVLLADPSQYVRLSAMNSLWRHAPDGPGTADLFWMAVETRGQRFVFHSDSRTWKKASAPGTSFVRVRVGGRRISVATAPVQGTFSGADRRRAADLLIHWHSPFLTGLLLRAGYQQEDLSAIITILPGSPVTLFSLSRFLEIFRRCRPAAAEPYLLRWIDAPGGGAGMLAPQGWPYFRSSRTLPLCLLMLDAGLNPTHFGIVKIGCSAASFSPPVICEFSRRQEAANLAKMRRWCQVRRILPAKARLPTDIPAANMIGLPANRRHDVTLSDMECGLISWYAWTGHLPAPQRHAMLAWGTKHLQVAAMAFASGIEPGMTAARLLSPDASESAQRILVHLVRSPAEAVSVGAISALWVRRPNAAVMSAVQRLAQAHAVAAETWTLAFHGRRLVIPRRFRHQPFWQMQSPQNRIWVRRLLEHWKRWGSPAKSRAAPAGITGRAGVPHAAT